MLKKFVFAFLITSSLHASTLQLESADLLLSFQGKGSSLSWDVGILEYALTKLPAMSEGRTIISANSGGSVIAVYLACHGISEQSIQKLKQLVLADDGKIKNGVKALRAVAENGGVKATQLVMGIIPGMKIDALDPFIEASLGMSSIDDLRNAKCVPQIPFVTVAANLEVIDSRHPNFKLPAGETFLGDHSDPEAEFQTPIVSMNEKVYSTDTMDVSWRPKTYQAWKTKIATPQGLAEFEKSHKNLKLGPTEFIGKACTYHATSEIADLLEGIDPRERLCDVKRIVTADDMATAIRASSAEPTYLHPFEESAPSQITTSIGAAGDLGNSKRRVYWGGFVLPLVAQDIRRTLPHLHVLGTGISELAKKHVQIVTALALVNPNDVVSMAHYWADTEIVPKQKTQTGFAVRDLTEKQEFQLGYERAKECFEQELKTGKPCRSKNSPPLHRGAASNALMTRMANEDVSKLKVGRGMKALMKNETSK